MLTLLPRILKWTEILGILVSITGYIAKIQQLAGADEMLMIGILTLAATYFLSGFIFVPIKDNAKPKGLADVLPTMLRKLMYIGLSIFLVGFLFSILHLEGARQMLLVGVGTLVGSVALSMVLILGNRDRMTLLQEPLFRGVIVLLVFMISFLR